MANKDNAGLIELLGKAKKSLMEAESKALATNQPKSVINKLGKLCGETEALQVKLKK